MPGSGLLNLRGVLLPVTTPFRPEDGEPDEAAFRSNLRAWLAQPIAGVVVAGSTGEAPCLEEDELLRLVEWAREECGDRLVVAGTGLESTRGTVGLSVGAARRGADAVLVRPPAYYRDAMDDGVLHAHFTRVADESPIPVLLYNIPRYVPVTLGPPLVRQLAPHPNVAGIKDSSGDAAQLGALAEACEGKATVLVGSGTAFYVGLEVGAGGGVLAVGLLATAAACELLSAHEAGDAARAGWQQERIGPLHRKVVGRYGVPGVKAALDLLGLEGGVPRPPLRPVSEKARREIESALAAVTGGG